jgi:hypothetical protein
MALLMVLSLAALMSAYLVANGLSTSATSIQNARNQKTAQALQEAKSALIAYAASQAWGNGANDQPGSLPCPDTDNDGTADSCGTSASTRTGRLPWKTLKTSDLRDASGEVLWYAVSANFRTASGTTVINSDTQGQLSIFDDQYSTSIPVLSNVVAVVIAADSALNGQNRSANSVAAFLDCRNGTLTDAFSMSIPPSGASSTCPHSSGATIVDFFNDRLVPITHADLFPVVESAVAARAERDLKQYFTSYKSAWGRYPFAAAFGDPGTSSYKGTVNTEGGLLPLTTDSAFVLWTNPTAATVSNTNSTTGTILLSSCSTSTSSTLQCEVYYTNRPTISISGSLQNVGMAFVLPPSSTDVTLVNQRGGANTFTSWSMATALAASGSATVSHTFRVPSSSPTSTTGCSVKALATCRRVTVTIGPPNYPSAPYSGITSASDAYAGWFVRNQWYKQVYYAVSPGLLPGGAGNCIQRSAPPAAHSSPSCLRIANLSSSYASNSDKEVILVLAGRSLNGVSRPTSVLANYLEGANITSISSPLYVYEHRSGRPTTINDRVVVIAP